MKSIVLTKGHIILDKYIKGTALPTMSIGNNGTTHGYTDVPSHAIPYLDTPYMIYMRETKRRGAVDTNVLKHMLN